MTKSTGFLTFEQAVSKGAQPAHHFFDVNALKSSLKSGPASRLVKKEVTASPLPKKSLRLAKRFLRNFEIDCKTSGFITPFSLCHLIYVELCTWIPIKIALRDYSFSDEIRTIIIPLSRESFNVCRLWKEENHLFEFYLAYELSKRYSVRFSLPNNSDGL